MWEYEATIGGRERRKYEGGGAVGVEYRMYSIESE